MLESNKRVAVYMEGHIDSDYGKMGTGVVRYLKNPIIGVIDKTHAGKSMTDFIDIEREIPIIKNVNRAIKLGAEVLVIGIAPSGGRIPDSWKPIIEESIK